MFPISHHGPEMKVMMSAISFGFEIIHSVAELKRIYLQFLHCTIRNKTDTTCMLSRDLLQYFLMALEAFIEENWVKFMSRTLSNWSKRSKISAKVLILAPELNVRLVTLSFPQCTEAQVRGPGVASVIRVSTHCVTNVSDLSGVGAAETR